MSRAYELYNVAVKRGSVIGYYNLGAMLMDPPKGSNIKRDITRAMNLFTNAAKDGHQLS